MGSIRHASAILLLAALVVATPAAASGGAADEEKVVEAVRQMFAALAKDDVAGFRAVTAPDFYAFDNGGNMTADQLVGVLERAHAAGTTFVWQVTEPRVRIDGRTAWITYVNRGSIRKGDDRKDISWLESAVLHKDGGAWRIDFLHSTAVPAE